ncbi:MAG: 4-(cytidine 5'-diphospho)-2-C-methyl-D-erythritol kinase [Bacillota bacterium]
MSHSLVIKARAKINLGLSVLGSRPDGFHQLETVMQQISLHDTLLFEPYSAESNCNFCCSNPELNGPDNLVSRAADMLQEHFCAKIQGVRVTLYKNIPVAAGLAGGSSDAAAALVGLNKFWQLGLSNKTLYALAGRLGSDVPFCLHGGTVLARGRGEQLEQLPMLPFFWVVLALPVGVQLSTSEAYRKFDRNKIGRPDLDPLVQAIRKNSRDGVIGWLKDSFTNTLETAILPGSDLVKNFKGKLQQYGLRPVFSGSGPTLFMLTDSYASAGGIARLVEELGGISYMCWTSAENMLTD